MPASRNAEVQAEQIEMRLGYILADSGKKLIAHSEELGFWLAQKTAARVSERSG